MRSENTKVQELEREVYNDWITSLAKKYPFLDKEAKEMLLLDLKEYLHKLLLKHGVECRAFLYPDDTSNNKAIKELLDFRLESILPERPKEISEIRNLEIPLFLKSLEGDARVLFAKLLDGAFLYHVIQMDPATFNEIKKEFSNYIFLLDTNIVYAILGLDSKKIANSIKATIESGRRAGMKFYVSTHTIKEMHESLSSQEQALYEDPPIKRELAEKTADISIDDSLLTAYYRAYGKTGITKAHFIQKLKNFPEILRSKGISIFSSIPKISKKELAEEKGNLNKTILIKKSEKVAIHDAYHKLAIEKLRHLASSQGALNKYWFLSLDGQLNVYGHNTKSLNEVPFVYLPHQLFQFLRMYSPRTKDYDTVFLNLFGSPNIKTAQNVLPNDYAQQVASVLSSFSDIPPQIGIRILIDESFLSEVKKSGKEVLAKKIEEKIEMEQSKYIKELEIKLKSLDKTNQAYAETKQGLKAELGKEKQLRADVILEKENIISTQEESILKLRLSLFVIAEFSILTSLTWILLKFGTLLAPAQKLIVFLITIAVTFVAIRIRWNIKLLMYLGATSLIVGIVAGLFSLLS